MRKFNFTLSLALLLTVVNYSHANPQSQTATRAVGEAMSIAADFLSSNSSSLSLSHTSKGKLRSGADKTFFYVFNRGDDGGYVIVSADSRTRNVLGYADAGSFDYAKLSASFRSWLNMYESEMESLDVSAAITASDLASTTVRLGSYSRYASTKASTPASVAPLIKTKWGQDAPFHNLCPKIDNKYTAVGCVATAMAQVMKYHDWPVKGFGSKSYEAETIKKTLSANFGSTTYEWSNMRSNYIGGAGSEAEKTAVATLMYHCGVSIEMNYDLAENDGSGAYISNVPYALTQYFGYDAGVNYHYRDFYGYYDWISILKTELAANRPILYGGASLERNGHAFVCDGYDSNGLFHFNWGWDSASDGYFELSALNPNSLGTGGGSGGYNYGQEIVTGIQRPVSGSAASENFIYEAMTVSKNSLYLSSDTFGITMYSVFNMGVKTFNGTIGFALCSTDNAIIGYYATKDKYVIEFNSGYRYYGLTGLSIPDNLSGTYKIVPAYAFSSSPNNVKLMNPVAGAIRQIDVVIANGRTTLTQAEPFAPSLQLVKFGADGNLYQNRTGQFLAGIKNTGKGDYNSTLAVIVQKGDTIFEPAVIPPGETKSIYFSKTINLRPGTYTVQLLFDEINYPDYPAWKQLGSATVTVQETPAEAALSVVSASFVDAARVSAENPNLSARILNSGGMFDGEIIAFIFNLNSRNSIAYFGQQKVLIDRNESIDVTLNSFINQPAGNYRTAIFYPVGKEWTQLSYLISFTLVSGVSAEIIPSNRMHVSLDKSNAVLYVYSETNVEELYIYNMMGGLQLKLQPNASGLIEVPVHALPAGSYVARIQSGGKEQTAKFIKR